MNGIEWRAAESGKRREDMSISEIGLRMLGQMATQCLYALALDPGDRDAGIARHGADRDLARWLPNVFHRSALPVLTAAAPAAPPNFAIARIARHRITVYVYRYTPK